MPNRNSPESEVAEDDSEIVSYPVARSARSHNDAARQLSQRAISSHQPLEFSDADVVRAKKYLRELVEKAEKNQTRKNSDEVGWAHSERVAENAYNLARFVFGDDKGKLNRVVILALLHDTVEDFGGDLRDIELKFGKDMARSVDLLTTPKPPFLALKYQDITTKFMPNEDLSDHTAEIMAGRLDQLKSHNHGTYKTLKAALNYQHKLDTFPHYGVDEILVKIPDNADSPRTDAKDIAERRIHIEAPTAPKRSDKTRRSWSEAKLRQKIDHRTEFHEALLTQLKKVRDAYNRRGNVGLKLRNFALLIDTASQLFTSKIENLERVTGLTLRAPQPT